MSKNVEINIANNSGGYEVLYPQTTVNNLVSGILPINQGGTGASYLYQAKINLEIPDLKIAQGAITITYNTYGFNIQTSFTRYLYMGTIKGNNTGIGNDRTNYYLTYDNNSSYIIKVTSLQNSLHTFVTPMYSLLNITMTGSGEILIETINGDLTSMKEAFVEGESYNYFFLGK